MKKFILIAADGVEVTLNTVPPPPETTMPPTAPTDACSPNKGPEPCITVPTSTVATELPEYVIDPIGEQYELPPFMGWEHWGFDRQEALTMHDIVVGGVYCQVNARYGPLETITVTGELTTAGEINPGGSEYLADSNVFPVERGWLGYVFTSDFGLEPYPSGVMNDVNRTFAGACPGGDTEFERMFDELPGEEGTTL